MVENVDIIANQRIRTNLNLLGSPASLTGAYEAMDILYAEGGESFYNYVDWLGLAKDPNLIVLSSQHHYYYVAEEMNNITTVVNLKELNQIKQIESFLHSSIHILPLKANFIGCFIDNKKINGYVLRNGSYINHIKMGSEAIENGIVSPNPYLNMFFSFMDLKTNKYMSRRKVTLLLEDQGFKVKDMTELNGLTYFHSQKVRGN